MAQIAKVMDHFQIALPAKIRNKFHIKVGDFLEARAVKEGILLKPKELVDKSQAYFWTKEWQEAEKKVDKHFKSRRFKTFESVEDFLKDLHK